MGDMEAFLFLGVELGGEQGPAGMLYGYAGGWGLYDGCELVAEGDWELDTYCYRTK